MSTGDAIKLYCNDFVCCEDIKYMVINDSPFYHDLLFELDRVVKSDHHVILNLYFKKINLLKNIVRGASFPDMMNFKASFEQFSTAIEIIYFKY